MQPGQTSLVGYFLAREKELGILSRAELRVQTGPENFRVPDVTILSRNAPREQIISRCRWRSLRFCLLKMTQTTRKLWRSLSDYERMGIAAIWVIEPKKRLYYRYRDGQLTPGAVFELPGSSFSVALAEIAALAD